MDTNGRTINKLLRWQIKTVKTDVYTIQSVKVNLSGCCCLYLESPLQWPLQKELHGSAKKAFVIKISCLSSG